MAEVVGIASAAVGFAATALHAVRALSNDLDGIKDAPQTITNAKTELQSVQSVIQSLKTSLDQPYWQPVLSDIIRNGNLEATLGACRDACSRFHDELKNLLRHSSEGELSRRDRLTVGFFSKGRVAAFISELSVCKSTIGLALSGTNLMVSMEQFQQLQVLANQHSTESRLRNDEAVDQDLAAGIERGAQLAKGCQGLLAFLQAKVDENRRRIELGNVETLNSARVMAGVNNTDGTEGDINIKVGNVKADGGKALLGYTSKVDVDAFFR
ncbi:Helo-like-N domain-containing protein [Fusarium falciforme]|uniref:Helo-like-N domain-containing protein n=1 Tax=Fusarium falciforme TaxID=195108 RepID=UPI0023008317|nr:Helo-like-N domain-containing protein [Fusarium falciforme]WAO89137.1 Helo-like-N domain-containing protein [Fusarium falciforme]